MSSLEELVSGALVAEKDEAPIESFFDIYKKNERNYYHSPTLEISETVYSEAELCLKTLSSSSLSGNRLVNAVSRFAACAGDPEDTIILLFLAVDYKNNPSGELLDKIKEMVEEIGLSSKRDIFNSKRSAAIGNFSKALFYLEDIFKEETPQIVSEAASVTETTAKKWLKVRTASNDSKRVTISLAEIIFRLDYVGKKDREIVKWYNEEKISASKTPRDHIRENRGGWRSPKAIDKYLASRAPLT